MTEEGSERCSVAGFEDSARRPQYIYDLQKQNGKEKDSSLEPPESTIVRLTPWFQSSDICICMVLKC